MWSGLLPPGVNENDVDTSSDDEETWGGPGPILKEEREQKDPKGIPSSGSETQEPESKPALAAVADKGQEFQACPPGVSLDLWKKFQSLQKKNFEIKNQVNQRDAGQKRKRSRKAKSKKKNEEVTESQQSIKESQLKELTQYFGINDRFKSLSSKEAPPKSGLEISIDRSLTKGDIAQAEELSDRLATRELGVEIAKAVACRNFVKAKQDADASQEARKRKKLAWGFEAKKRWETKSNMGYM
ncbi:protein FAM204A [Rhineura floridana]|uniref:protein FAM204A n=1 Tax=Rhineura floridana TaxID=261503 RepID=UPI002AC81B39|nr:protein FAM204A [Rhineura floridana]XP_061491851.1 protein FAM204A [Rhineura floridana]XP_061491852.1 protein FAM204A [Rhineura floridana]XP_061491853.1 protein FAM204A [Rhineura floridana]